MLNTKRAEREKLFKQSITEAKIEHMECVHCDFCGEESIGGEFLVRTSHDFTCPMDDTPQTDGRLCAKCARAFDLMW